MAVVHARNSKSLIVKLKEIREVENLDTRTMFHLWKDHFYSMGRI